MKKATLALALLPMVSFAESDLQGLYAGVDIGLFNTIELEALGMSADQDIDGLPFNIYAGYDVVPTKNVSIGFEAEYRWLSEGKYKSAGQTILKVEGYGLSINVRPKFRIPQSPVYVGLLAGFGQYKNKATVYIDGDRMSDSATNTGWQYGAELGYILENNLVVSLGYRTAKIDIDEGVDLEAKQSGFNLGIQYRF